MFVLSPDGVVTYVELGEKRAMSPKLDVVKVYELLKTLILRLCGFLCLSEELLCTFWVAKRRCGSE